MANEQNLVPFTSDQSRDQAKKNGRKGGVASGKAKRQRKTLAQIGDMIGEMGIKSPKIKKTLKDAGIENEDMINDVAIMYRLVLKARAGEPRAIELLAKLRGQFKEQVETTVLEPPKPLSPRKQRK